MSDKINSDAYPPENESAGTPEVKKKNGKPVLIAILATVVVVLAFALIYFSYNRNNFVKTENASVQCNMIAITAKISGTVLDIKVKQGDHVREGDVLMELNPANADSSQIDNSYVRSATDGSVLKVLGTPGQSVSAGQTAAYVASDEDLFVISNIDEKDINKIKIGQIVDIKIDQFGNQKFYGKVVEVGAATLSAFSIVPASSSGTFVKAVQLVPVKIRFTQSYDELLVGANATVSVHIR